MITNSLRVVNTHHVAPGIHYNFAEDARLVIEKFFDALTQMSLNRGVRAVIHDKQDGSK